MPVTISKKELGELIARITQEIVDKNADKGLSNPQINSRVYNKILKLVSSGEVNAGDAFIVLLPKLIEGSRKSYTRSRSVTSAIVVGSNNGDMFGGDVADSLIDAGGITIRTGSANDAVIADKDDAITDNLVAVTDKHSVWKSWHRPVRDFLRDHPGSTVDDALAVLSKREQGNDKK
jgi:hypothetical protein